MVVTPVVGLVHRSYCSNDGPLKNDSQHISRYISVFLELRLLCLAQGLGLATPRAPSAHCEWHAL